MDFIDLHTHTCYSLKCADKLELSLFSVTDHNTVDAYDEIDSLRYLFRGDILPGVELSTVFYGEVIEVLGYGINIVEMKKLIGKNYMSFYDKQVGLSPHRYSESVKKRRCAER